MSLDASVSLDKAALEAYRILNKNQVCPEPERKNVVPEGGVEIIGEVYFQPYEEVPVKAFLVGEDGRAYEYNNNIEHYVNPFSQRGTLLKSLSEEDLEVILQYSKVERKDGTIEEKQSYQSLSIYEDEKELKKLRQELLTVISAYMDRKDEDNKKTIHFPEPNSNQMWIPDIIREKLNAA